MKIPGLRGAVAVALVCGVWVSNSWRADAAKKKNPDDVTQTLDLPKDPPTVAAGETRRLVFHVSPLSAKGLLSAQTRDAIKAILKMNGNAPVVHLRAFVAGSGDLRRVPQIVSEVFTEHKMSLPSVSVVQAGALPLEGAQVQLEAVSVAKKEVNANGLRFESVDQFASAGDASAVAVTCFAGENLTEAAGTLRSRFPSAALTVVQLQRYAASSEPKCEAIVPGGALTARQLAFTGTRVAFGSDEKAIKAAYDHIARELAEAGAESSAVVAMNVYALSAGLKFPQAANTAFSLLPVEGVASLDATFAIDAVAPVK